MYASLTVHTDVTIAEGRNELLRFGEVLQVSVKSSISSVRVCLLSLCWSRFEGVSHQESTEDLGFSEGAYSPTLVSRYQDEGSHQELQYEAWWENERPAQEILSKSHQFQRCCTTGEIEFGPLNDRLIKSIWILDPEGQWKGFGRNHHPNRDRPAGGIGGKTGWAKLHHLRFRRGGVWFQARGLRLKVPLSVSSTTWRTHAGRQRLPKFPD